MSNLTHLVADTSFMSWWERMLFRLTSAYIIKEYADGSFHVYQGGFFGGHLCWNTNEFGRAVEWCEKQLVGRRVKGTTYVMEDE